MVEAEKMQAQRYKHVSQNKVQAKIEWQGLDVSSYLKQPTCAKYMKEQFSRQCTLGTEGQ